LEKDTVPFVIFLFILLACLITFSYVMKVTYLSVDFLRKSPLYLAPETILPVKLETERFFQQFTIHFGGRVGAGDLDFIPKNSLSM